MWLAGLVLFWPAVLGLFLLGFCCIVFAVFLIGSTVLVFTIFLYGLYCILRDLGLLDWLFERMGTVSNYISDHVKKNVEESFVFEVCGKTVSEPALYLCHPHGLYGISWFIHFAGALSKWPLESRPVLAVHSVFFHIPILRELFQKNRCIEATEEEIQQCLKEGKSVALLVGGIEELSLTQPGTMKLILKKRQGYARIALNSKVPLVPVISPSENELFPAITNPVWKWIQEKLYSSFRIALPLPSIDSLWSWITIAYKPFSTPLQTYILNPVYPDEKSLEDIKSAYESTITQFSNEYSIPIQLVN
jgi:hypothetical protein